MTLEPLPAVKRLRPLFFPQLLLALLLFGLINSAPPGGSKTSAAVKQYFTQEPCYDTSKWKQLPAFFFSSFLIHEAARHRPGCPSLSGPTPLTLHWHWMRIVAGGLSITADESARVCVCVCVCQHPWHEARSWRTGCWQTFILLNCRETQGSKGKTIMTAPWWSAAPRSDGSQPSLLHQLGFYLP